MTFLGNLQLDRSHQKRFQNDQVSSVRSAVIVRFKINNGTLEGLNTLSLAV